MRQIRDSPETSKSTIYKSFVRYAATTTFTSQPLQVQFLPPKSQSSKKTIRGELTLEVVFCVPSIRIVIVRKFGNATVVSIHREIQTIFSP